MTSSSTSIRAPALPAAAGPGAGSPHRALRSVDVGRAGARRMPLPPGPDRARGAFDVLLGVARALDARLAGGEPASIALDSLDDDHLDSLAQLLGRGEIEARVEGAAGLQARESAFAGVWCVRPAGSDRDFDVIDVGAVPRALLEAARIDALTLPAPTLRGLPEGSLVPALLQPLQQRARDWRPGVAAHVVNLTLLDLDRQDRADLDRRLGRGRARVQARGRGEGGIAWSVANTRLPRTWRVCYVRAGATVVLDTLEVTGMPEVACAAVHDLQDSAERLREVLDWMRGS